MAFLNDEVLDGGLSVLDTATTTLHICSQEPVSLAEANSTYTLGNKASLSISAPSNRSPNGREVTISSFSDGTVTGTGTVTHYAIVDGTRLLATNSLSASQAVTSGNTFSLGSFTIGIPDGISA
jgi:hypothetical protein